MEKHLERKTLPSDVLLQETEDDKTYYDAIIFQRITGETIKEIENRTQGATGPSGVHAHARRRFWFSFNSAQM